MTNQGLLQKIQELETYNNIFANNVSLKRNNEVKPFSCKYCNETFVQVHDVKEHIKIHLCNMKPSDNLKNDTEVTQVQIKCEICDVVFRLPAYLKKHMKTKHSVVKNDYSCNECHKRFKSKNYLTTHIIRTHSKRKFKCFKCDYEYLQKYSLTRHKCGNSLSEEKKTKNAYGDLV